jgi:hypothetical protein
MGQDTLTAYVKGKVINTSSPVQRVSDVQILIDGQFFGNISDANGEFLIKVPANKSLELTFKYVPNSKTIKIAPISPQNVYDITVQMEAKILSTVTIQDTRRQTGTAITLNPKNAYQLPKVGSGVEGLIKSMPGVASGNELSAQYNVRGGSFDENLVYVNDFEIFRPQLIRTGQQEGLSFINPFMVNNIQFSAGGFEARYGDKLSSVLDVAYRTPDSLQVIGEVSFLGAELNVGGRSKNHRFSHISGVRYRANNTLLNSLDVKGQYNPKFFDFQSLMVFRISKYTRLEWLNNIANNTFQLEPVSQTTSFGTVQSALQLYVGMAGNEIMRYQNNFSGLSFVFEPSKQLVLKWMASHISAVESEKYDILGAYRLDVLDNNLGSSNFGQTVATLGNGFFINHARNELSYSIQTIEHKGTFKPFQKKLELNWGVSVRQDLINDKFKEWRYSDSSEYNSNPIVSFDSIILSEYIKSAVDLTNIRQQNYIQAQHVLNADKNSLFTFGLRSHYSSLNQQLLVSPRLQYSIEPNKKFNKEEPNDSLKKKDYTIRVAAGFYHQPPFYREMRDFDGNINTQIRAQQSFHLITGVDYYFKMWGRDFKLLTEVYYKQLNQLVPYIQDNMRIRYYAENASNGYATGLDTRINGQFIEGLESWFTFSLLKTDEKIRYLNAAGEEIESPFLRRPTDRRVSAAMFFQDELERYPNCRVNLNIVFGAPLPYFLPGEARYKEGLNIPAYTRLDAGFNYLLLKEGDKDSPLARYFSSLWAGLEVFNMLGINNVISYLWVKDINNAVYGVPNFLTGRRVSLRLVATL